MSQRKAVDWEAIEREYRAGQLSLREIGRQHGIGAPAIVKRAAKLGWERDLSASVRETAQARLVKETAAGNTLNARETVDAAADRVVSLVREHRTDIRSDVARLSRLCGKLDALIDGVSDLKVLETAQGIMESIARTRAKLIPLERQAFNLDAATQPGDGAPSVNIYMPTNGRDQG